MYSEAIKEMDNVEQQIIELASGKDNDLYKSFLIWKASIYSDIKDDSFKAEEYLKDTMKWIEDFHNRLIDKDNYFYKVGVECEVMAHYIKIQRPDKTQKIYKEVKTYNMQHGNENTFAQLLADFLYVQTLTDLKEMQDMIDLSLKKSKIIDE